MADEDRPLTHSRDLSELFDQYGIVQPSRAEYQEIIRGLQQTIQVDDASHLFRPLTVPVGWFQLSSPAAGAGIHSASEIYTSSRGGAYITSIYPQVASVYLATDQVWTYVLAFAVGAAGFPTDRVAEFSTTATAGSVAAAARPANRIPVPNGAYSALCPFWLPPGKRLLIFCNTANSPMNCAISVQEVP